VARFSPSGYLMASGDSKGTVRIWGWDHPDHVLRLDVTHVGSVFDVAWSPDSERLVIVGEGKERYDLFFLLCSFY